MATNIGRAVTYYEVVPPVKSHDNIITWSWEITSQIKNVSTTTMHMVIKLGRIVTYLEWLSPIKSHDHIIVWSCEIT